MGGYRFDGQRDRDSSERCGLWTGRRNHLRTLRPNSFGDDRITAFLEKRCREIQDLLRLAQSENQAITSQAKFLRTNLCDEVREYLYSQPMPAAGLGDFLRKWAQT